ncbi:hypothetical protein DYB31_016062, partial [Aphanomyces astaci]
MWTSSTSQIGIVDVHMTLLPSGWSYHVAYDILVSFPDLHKEWTVRRSHHDFVELHRHLVSAYVPMFVLARESRVEFQVSVEARYAQSAKRMRERLNAYLHRLLELPDISASAAFRGF